MNLFCKLGLAVLAGGAVLLGINGVESSKSTKTKTKKDNERKENKDSNTFVSGNPNERSDDSKNDNNSGSGKFMKKMKKAQTVVEIVSKVVGCIYRICECINEVFGNKRNYGYCNGYYQPNNGNTTIIL
jgi:hypothetical protein